MFGVDTYENVPRPDIVPEAAEVVAQGSATARRDGSVSSGVVLRAFGHGSEVPGNVVTHSSAVVSSISSSWERSLHLVLDLVAGCQLRDFARGWGEHPAAATSTMTTIAQATGTRVCLALLEALKLMALEPNDFHFGAAIHSCEPLGLCALVGPWHRSTGAWRQACSLLELMAWCQVGLFRCHTTTRWPATWSPSPRR